MSNRYNAKFIVIDTTDTQIGGPEADGGPKGPLSIRLLQWVNTQARAIANDHDLTIEWARNGGDIIIAARAIIHETAGSQDFAGAVFYEANFGGEPWIVPGLFIEDIDGGELLVILE